MLLSMLLLIYSLKESVFVPRVPTHSFFLSLSLTLSIAFLRPPLHCGFGSMCQLSLLLGDSGTRRDEERDCLRRRSVEIEVRVVWCLRV